MATGEPEQGKTHKRSHRQQRAHRARRIALVAAVAFLISLAFPVAAGVARDTSSFPVWWGVVDVGLAFGLAVFAFALATGARGRVTPEIEHASYRVYRVVMHGILGILVVFLIAGDRIAWVRCLPGLAWRSWLLLYCLPDWLASARARQASAPPN